MHGSGKLPWGHGLCTMCDQCRATSSLSHSITGWALTRLTDAGQSSFCSLAAMVSHVAREHWLEVFWILLIGSRHRNAHWDLWNGTIAICRVSPGGVLWVLMTSPSSMLVTDHCVCKGQHSTFDDSWRSYLCAWKKFAGNVTNSIILVMCVHSRLFCDWKL